MNGEGEVDIQSDSEFALMNWEMLLKYVTHRESKFQEVGDIWFRK